MRVKGIISCILMFLVITAWAEMDIKAEDTFTSSNDLYSGEFIYLIGSGDILEIKVWRHPDLETKAVVRPDGKISFPIIGDVSANNSTVAELENRIAVSLGKIINNPQVNINVVGFYSKKVFVLGEVNKPGVYPFEGRVTVIDAISRASGYREKTAALKSIIVIRGGDTPKAEVLRLNIYKLIKNGDPSQNIFLAPSDIVFVPKTFISDLNDFIELFFSKTDPVLQYYLDGYNIARPGILNR